MRRKPFVAAVRRKRFGVIGNNVVAEQFLAAAKPVASRSTSRTSSVGQALRLPAEGRQAMRLPYNLLADRDAIMPRPAPSA